MSGAELFSWYSIGFVAVFMVGLVLLLIGMLGLGGDHDADVSHDTEHDGEAHSVLLDFLGIGRCPLSIVLMVMSFLFSLFGMAAVILLRMVYTPGAIVGAVAYPAATVLSFMLTGVVARLIGRFMPTSETYVESESHHFGSIGKAVYTFTDGKGFVQVKDKSGTVHEVAATCAEPIMAGSTVVVIGYDEGTRVFQVQLAPLELGGAS